MNIPSTTGYITPFLKAIDKAIQQSVCVQLTKTALENALTVVDHQEPTRKKIGTVAFAVIAILGAVVAGIGVGLESAIRSIQEINAEQRLHPTSIKVAAYVSAFLLAPGIGMVYVAFSFSTILEESIKRFKEPAPLPQMYEDEVAASMLD